MLSKPILPNVLSVVVEDVVVEVAVSANTILLNVESLSLETDVEEGIATNP